MAYNFLLVDDSAIVRKVIIKSLGMTDIEIGEMFEAANGKEALEVLKKNWIDLVFLDINMPVMNGMEFMQSLQADETLKSTPVVVVSTEGSKLRRQELEELGVKAYQRKPVTPESLTDAVKEVLEKARR